MGEVTLNDLRLTELNFVTLPRLARLRRQSLAARTEVCIERARAITTFLRDHGDAGESMAIRYARAVHHFLAGKLPLFPDDSLLAGTTTSKAFGAPVYPELTGLTIWPELDTISSRSKNPQLLSPVDAEELNLHIFPYWLERTILEATRSREGSPPALKLFERIVFFIAGKAGTISHTVPAYQLALSRGLEAIIAEAAAAESELRKKGDLSLAGAQQRDFYRAVQIALSGLLVYAARLSARARELADQEEDPAKRENLLAMAAVCARVPAQPARTFREAVNGLWLLQIAIHAESINMAISPGRLDQILLPWYEEERENRTLTRKDALELLGCLWLKLGDNTNLVPETGEELFGGAGTVPAVTIGGINPAGEDAVNEVTYLILRVAELLQSRDPSLNARYHLEKNPPAYRDRLSEVIAATRSIPALYNDLAAIRTLENQGIDTPDARDYAIIGCVELASAGRSYDASSSIMLNLVAALELALYNGRRPITGAEQISPPSGDPASFTTFAEFEAAFQRQLRWLINEAVTLNEMLGKSHQELLPTPLLSALMVGPLEQGKDLLFGGARYNSSGATHIGFADTVDSLNAIEQGVFIDRICTFSELLSALRRDFREDAPLHACLNARMPKYGSEAPLAIKNSHNLLSFLYETYQGYCNYRGGKYRPAYWTMTNHAGQGKLCGALPSGRRANRVFSSGITPVAQAAVDLAPCLHAVGGLDPCHLPGGAAFNLKYDSLTDPEERQKFRAAIDAYFRCGGLHIQFNLWSYETLLAARAHPEEYPELLVRVSGYSAYFKDLNDAMKDEIITRTAYDLQSGRALPLPSTARGILPTA